MEWLANQWKDIKGHFKWDLLKWLAGGISMTALWSALEKWIRHVPLDWLAIGVTFVSSLVGLFLVSLLAARRNHREPGAQGPEAGNAGAKSKTFANAFRKVQVYPENPEDNEALRYKWKVRIVIKNETGKTADVRNPVWIANGGEVSLELPAKMKMQIERIKDGWRKDQWVADEFTELQLPPDFAFRTWIGLHEKLTDRDFGRLQENKQFGTLSLSVDGDEVRIAI